MNLKDFSEHVFRQWERHERDADVLRAEKASELRTAVEKWVRHAAKHPEKDGISRAADEIMSAAQEYMSRCIGAGERR